MLSKIRSIRNSANRRSWQAPLLLLLAAVLAYGLLIPWLGFYWDDWPKTLFAETLGPGAFANIAEHRPLNGWWYVGLLSFFSTRPLAWQLVALFWHWASAAALWWMLGKLWPKKPELALWTALLFVLYPGFSQSPIAFTYFVHFLAYTMFFCSLGAMLIALKSRQRSTVWHGLSLLLALMAMLTTDYFYGLELLRPLVIWMAADSKDWRGRGRYMLTTWLPYLILAALLFLWRGSLDSETGYELALLDELAEGGAATLPDKLALWGSDLVESVWGAWKQAFAELGEITGRSFVDLLSILLAGSSFLFFFWRLGRQRPTVENAAGTSNLSPLLLAFVALLLAGIPSWVAGLVVKLNFPGDRLLLPFAFGASLLVAGLIRVVLPGRRLRVLLIAALAAAAIFWHFQVADAFRRDGEQHADFWQQFAWRVPHLKEGSVVLSHELPLAYFSDDSLTGVLNLLYPRQDWGERLPYELLYIDLRLGGVLPALEMDLAIVDDYRLYHFEGLTSQAIVIYYEPPGCLRVLDPALDQHDLDLPELIQEALPLSSFAQIAPDVSAQAELPRQLHPLNDESSWCYHYEKAELARQFGDWQQIAALGDRAFNLDDAPDRAAEYIPFVQGYALSGDWKRAVGLSRQALASEGAIAPMLCAAWSFILEESEHSPERQDALQEIENQADCGLL